MPGIALTIEYLSPDNYLPGTVPMRVTAVSSEPGLESEIFVFHATSTTAPWTGDQFETIASVVQMQELPVDAPAPATEDTPAIPFYRKDVVEFVLYTMEELEDIWKIIKEETKLLIKQHRLADKIEQQETVTIDPD